MALSPLHYILFILTVTQTLILLIWFYKIFNIKCWFNVNPHNNIEMMSKVVSDTEQNTSPTTETKNETTATPQTELSSNLSMKSETSKSNHRSVSPTSTKSKVNHRLKQVRTELPLESKLWASLSIVFSTIYAYFLPISSIFVPRYECIYSCTIK